MNTKTWAVKYATGLSSTVKLKEFKTEAARSRWIDKQLDAGAISILAYSDPQ
jgi:hypothetical protein